MLGILIVLFALSGIQGKAFPSRNKRNYEVSYHYIPYEEGIVRIPAGYSPGNLPNYQDYINGHVQPNKHHWPVYYDPTVSFRSTKNPYSNVNTHHKVKAEHHWHFIDQTPIPITRYSDGIHKFESGMETQNGNEALHEKDSQVGHDTDYEVPVVVEALNSEDHVDPEIPVDSLTIKGNHLGYGNEKYPDEAYPSINRKLTNLELLNNKQKPPSSYEFTKLDAGDDNDDFELPVVVDSLTMKDKEADSYNVHKPVKSIPFISSDESELPVVVDSLTKKDKNDAYYKHEPAKKKPVKTTHFISSGELELPVVVDSLTKKEKEDSYFEHEPAKTAQFISSDEFELPVSIDSLSKVNKADHYYTNEPSKKPVKTTHFISSDELELPVVVDSLTKKKEADTYYVHGPPKEKPAKNAHLGSSKEMELPGIIDSLSKKNKPTKIKPMASYHKHELPAVNSYGKNEDAVVKPAAPDYAYEPIKEKPVVKPIKEKPVVKPIKEKPVVKPIKEKPVVKPIKEKPVVKPIKEKPVVKPIKEKPVVKPIKEKPVVKPIAFFDASDYPLESDLLNEADDYETPIVVEALIRKEEPKVEVEDYGMPVVVEALVSKHPPGYENEKLKQGIISKDSFHSSKDALTEEEFANVGGPTVQVLSLNEGISNKTPEQESVVFDDADGFEIEDGENIDHAVDALSLEEDVESNETPKRFASNEDFFIETNEGSFDEAEDEGSAMSFDGSHFSKSFNPVKSNTFSEVTNKEQGRREFKSCVTLKKETGRCMPFQLCSLSSAANNIDELLRNVCIIDEVFLGVCCPAFPVETVKVDWEQLKPDTDKIPENSSEISKVECGKLPENVTDKDTWPWMALLIARSSDKIFCGGALISEQYVLTAAHCTKRIPRNRILVRLGSSISENNPKQDFEVIEIKRHSGYNPRSMQNDIALLKLSRRVRFGNFRRAVCLAKADESFESLVSESASLLRWKETPGEIKDVESLLVISRRECQNGMRTAISNSIICTEPRTDETMCNADSGAPLVMAKDDKFEVIGILTWNRNDCDERFPTVFTRVSSYHQWIENLAM